MSTDRHGQKRDRIIEAAVRVFAQKGFHTSRISDIAREAQVASGTIYLYFRNKDNILISVFEDSLERIITEIKEALDGIDDPRAKLQCFIEHHLTMLKRHRELAEVLQVELRQSHKFMKEYEPAHWIEYLNIIAAILEEGKRKGVFRTDLSLGIFKRAVFGALDEIALHWILTRKDELYLEHAARQLYGIVLEGVLARDGQGAADPSANRGAGRTIGSEGPAAGLGGKLT